MKKKFLLDQAIVNSIGAEFQHAGVYVKDLKDHDERKKALRDTLTKELYSRGKKYRNPVTDDEHCRNILNLAETVTEDYRDSGILRDGRGIRKSP